MQHQGIHIEAAQAGDTQVAIGLSGRHLGAKVAKHLA
jgi:hypothetical protein